MTYKSHSLHIYQKKKVSLFDKIKLRENELTKSPRNVFTENSLYESNKKHRNASVDLPVSENLRPVIKPPKKVLKSVLINSVLKGKLFILIYPLHAIRLLYRSRGEYS